MSDVPFLELTEADGETLLAVIDMREIIAVSRVENERFVVVLKTGTALTAPVSGFESTAQTWIDWKNRQ